MTWTTPKTWTTEPLTSLDMNTHIRDNLNALKNPPTVEASPNTTTSTSSTSFVNLNGTSLSITTTGGDILVGWTGFFRSATATYDTVEVALRFDSTDYLVGRTDDINYSQLAGTRLITGVSAGTHTLNLRGRISAGTAQIHIYQIWVREVS
jgi:hypothetical protein